MMQWPKIFHARSLNAKNGKSTKASGGVFVCLLGFLHTVCISITDTFSASDSESLLPSFGGRISNWLAHGYPHSNNEESYLSKSKSITDHLLKIKFMGKSF